MNDLERGFIRLDAGEEETWIQYKDHQVLVSEGVVHSQFVAPFKDHKNQVVAKMLAFHFQETALLHDRAIHPKESHDSPGRQIWGHSAVKLLLECDVGNRTHDRMTPSEL